MSIFNLRSSILEPETNWRKAMKRLTSQFRLSVAFVFTGLFGSLLITPAQDRYDFLLKGGHVIDPRNSIDGNIDVAIAQGKIAAVAANLPVSQAQKVID